MIKIDLGCQKDLNGFHVRNFHSGNNWEDGTKQFKITLCNSSVSSLTPGSSGCQDRIFNLGKISNRWFEKTVFIPLEPAVSVRLVAIRIQSFFGQRGGLHYFRENEDPDPGSSYQGRNINAENHTHLLIQFLSFFFSLFLQQERSGVC